MPRVPRVYCDRDNVSSVLPVSRELRMGRDLFWNISIIQLNFSSDEHWNWRQQQMKLQRNYFWLPHSGLIILLAIVNFEILF